MGGIMVSSPEAHMSGEVTASCQESPQRWRTNQSSYQSTESVQLQVSV